MAAPSNSREQSRGYETSLAHGFRSLKSILVNSSTIYVAESMVNGSVYSLTVDGKNTKILAEDLKLPVGLATDSSSLYCGGFGAYSDLGGWHWGELKKIRLATRQIVDLAQSGYLDGIFSIAVSPPYVYYLCYWVGVPVRIPIDGGLIEYLDNGTLKDNQFVSTYAYGWQPMTLLATESNLYYSFQGNIYTRPTTDNGLITKLTTYPSYWSGESVDYIPSMVMDSQYIFFVNTITGFVRKVPLTGGNVVTLAEGLDHPNNIAVDDGYVYWNELGLNSGGGSIKRMPKNGGAITALVDGLGEVGGIALDKDFVYWTEGDSVNKIAKNATAPTFSPLMATSRTVTFIGNTVAMTGQLNSPADVSNVTLQYSLDNGKTWSLLAELSTDHNGNFSYDWKPAKEGEYLVRAIWNPSIRYQEVMTNSLIIVSITGDITGPSGLPDGTVNMRDVGYVAKRFGTTPSNPMWNPNADIDGNGIINMKDIGLVAKNFGK